MGADRWLSTYLVYEEPWRDLLREGVKPFVAQAEADGFIDRFFFVRYYERGPHIRLRLRVTVDETTVRELLDRHFGVYMQTRPSPAPATDIANRFPLNTLQYVPYEPEVDRYGGPELIAIAEQQFDASSRAALALLDEEATYDGTLSAAMWMHLTFVLAASMTREEAATFFDAAIRSFSHWHSVPLGDLVRTFANRFAPQRETIGAHVRGLWDTLQGEHDVAWLREWQDAMGPVHDAVRARATNPLPILLSYVHMTNNRLGVRNPDEAWLAFLLSRSLQA